MPGLLVHELREQISLQKLWNTNDQVRITGTNVANRQAWQGIAELIMLRGMQECGGQGGRRKEAFRC